MWLLKLYFKEYYPCCCCCSITKSCPTPLNPWIASYQAPLSLTITLSFPKFMSIISVMPSSHLILWWPLLLLPSIFPSIRDFSNESPVCIRWPKYWNFSFSISPSKEYLGLISIKIDWFHLLAVQGTLRSLPQHSSKALILQCYAFFVVQLSQPYVTTGKTIALTIWPLSADWCLCFPTHCLGLSWLSCQKASIWFHG